MKITSLTFAASLALLSTFLTAPITAQVLMLDFGSTTAAGDDLTNSPYHTANPAFSGTTWNTLDNTDPVGPLKWSTGTDATDITATIGIGSATTDYASVSDINLASNPSNVSALGSTTKAGIYAGSTAGKDGVFTAVTGDNAFSAVGLQIAGLSAGIYDIYITARNTNAAGHSQRVFAGTSSDAGNFAYIGYETQTLSYEGAPDFGTSAWTEGVNYAKLSVTITSGEVLNIVSLGGSFQNRGFLNSVQIVSPIPEPSSYALFAGLAGVAAIVARRRRN